MSLTNCRFYEQKYPEIDSFVMVNVSELQWISGTTRLILATGQASALLLSLDHRYDALADARLDCRNGRICQAIRVRQYRRHDLAIRIVAASDSKHTEIDPGWEERSRGSAKGRQREGYSACEES